MKTVFVNPAGNASYSTTSIWWGSYILEEETIKALQK